MAHDKGIFGKKKTDTIFSLVFSRFVLATTTCICDDRRRLSSSEDSWTMTEEKMLFSAQHSDKWIQNGDYELGHLYVVVRHPFHHHK